MKTENYKSYKTYLEIVTLLSKLILSLSYKKIILQTDMFLVDSYLSSTISLSSFRKRSWGRFFIYNILWAVQWSIYVLYS